MEERKLRISSLSDNNLKHTKREHFLFIIEEYTKRNVAFSEEKICFLQKFSKSIIVTERLLL